MKPADRSRIRQFSRALAWDWEDSDSVFGMHLDQMLGGDLEAIRMPSDFRNDWNGYARQPIAINPFA